MQSSARRFMRWAGWATAGAAFLPVFVVSGCDTGASSGTGRSRETLSSKDGTTGVTVCDSYLDQYTTCAQSLFARQQFNQHLKGIQQQRASWASLADTPPKRDALSAVCRKAISTARAEFPSCTFTDG
jgi:hypothetical protein